MKGNGKVNATSKGDRAGIHKVGLGTETPEGLTLRWVNELEPEREMLLTG